MRFLPFFLLMFSFCLRAADWPGEERAEDGMLWFWQNLNAPGMVETRDGDWVRDCEARLRGLVRPNHFLAAEIRHGAVEAVDMGVLAAEALRAEDGLHLEMALHPSGHGPVGGQIFFLGIPGEDPVLAMEAREGKLWVRSGGEPAVELGDFPADRAFYLAVSARGNEVESRVDGERHGQRLLAVRERIGAEHDGVGIFFGDELNGGRGWNGYAEFLLLAGKPRPEREPAAAWQKETSGREAPPVTVVEARLVAAANEPAPVDLEEYAECLLASVWRIERVVEGSLPEGEELLLWDWYQLDRVIVEAARPPPPGTRRLLTISPVSSQPQMQGIQTVQEGLDPLQILMLPDLLILRNSPLER